jgi:hypothetical protein
MPTEQRAGLDAEDSLRGVSRSAVFVALKHVGCKVSEETVGKDTEMLRQRGRKVSKGMWISMIL